MHGWHLAGSHPANYEHGIRTTENFEGRRVAHLRCVTKRPTGFGTLMQTIAADDFRGRRVRFSAAVCAADADWAGLWMRVDGSHGGAPLPFDNMQQRPISGTTQWQRHNIVLDIADHARAIAFGVLLAGKGDVRVSDLAFEVVPSDVLTTGDQPLPRRPQNLDLGFL